MQQFVLMTAVGADRVGIVDDVSKEILNRDCNIEESRMTLLGGDFAMLVLVSGSAQSADKLMADGPAIAAALGLTVLTRKTSAAAAPATSLPYLLESTSLDSPGIVHGVASLLRKSGVNITDLETDTQNAPLTGAPLFTLRAHLVVPKTLAIADLRRELEALEKEHNLDIQLKPLA